MTTLIQEIKTGASRIRNETQEGANTAERVGALLEKIANAIEQTQITGTIEEFNKALKDNAGNTFNPQK